MDKHLKKAIAREGLILFGFIILALVGLFAKFTTAFDYRAKEMYFAVIFFTALSYAVYLSVHFIFWAVKTLKEK